MARIFANQELPDYFATVDLASAPAETLQEFVRSYEDGKVVLVENSGLDFDRGLIQSILFPPERSLKKFKSHAFVEAYRTHGELDRNVVELVFRGDRRKAVQFVDEISRVNVQLERLIARLFAGYRIEQHRITWRLTETVNENLHVDVYREDIETHHVRLFVNLDDIPRIWHTSLTLEHLLGHFMDLLDPTFLEKATAGEICRELNAQVFGGWDLAGRDGRPRHVAFFEPGEVWLVDSRKVAHQIFYGRRALSTESSVDPDSMADPEKHYIKMVNKARRDYLQDEKSGGRFQTETSDGH